MAERERLRGAMAVETGRSTEDIRQNIAKEKENIALAVEQIDGRIKEKLDWRVYVKDSPYLTIGAAVGLGFLAAGMLRTRTTPMERIMGSIEEKVHDALGGPHAGVAGPDSIRLLLLGIAAQAAAGWIKNTDSATLAGDGDKP